MPRVDSWVKDWAAAPNDPLVLKPYLLPSEELFPPTQDTFRFLRVWRGPATDRLRLDLTEAAAQLVGAGIPRVHLRVSALGGCVAPGLLAVTGQWTIDTADPLGALVQVSGLLTDGWAIEGFVDSAVWAGAPIKLGIRALVDRVGGSFGVVRGLLLP